MTSEPLAWTVRTHILETFEVPPFGCHPPQRWSVSLGQQLMSQSGNCTVIGDLRDRRAVCIDPGGDIKRIMKLLSAYRLSLTQILITHGVYLLIVKHICLKLLI